MLTLVSIHFLLLGFFNPTDLPYAEIENSFEINDSDLIISNCEEMVLMDIEDDEGIYNHSQARMVLNDFFTSYPNGNFEYSFQGKESDEEIFSLAYYTVLSLKFTVLMSFSKLENKIQSIRISK
tara:strand:+ start:61 stop:432 length:372 start_codon:yes stop_codon:yes gene_type:complete